ncbi:hypothetical protein FH969_14260 [Miniimonas arenae]|uniref:Septum formation-related domain-containing protein n=1 Tax=Miniimonas arenae TaxID=676201 RepID=A0A5C5BA87_9MICO|nr:septum formation family protein [Miniimonas arenae]TNU72905.1 hypothetical protein FH969_14260 [Miniimonas arenae]
MSRTITPRLRAVALVAGLIAAGGLTAACSSGSAFSLEKGDCFNDPDDTTEVSDVPIVDCSEAHDNEVYAEYDIDGDDYPGTDAVQQEASDFCLKEFESFVGASYEDTTNLDVYMLYPTDGSWDQGDRTVTCAVYSLDGQSTGTLAGSGA